MPKRSFDMACLSPSRLLQHPAEADFITTVTAVNTSGLAADDFEAVFTGIGGSISDITVLFSSDATGRIPVA